MTGHLTRLTGLALSAALLAGCTAGHVGESQPPGEAPATATQTIAPEDSSANLRVETGGFDVVYRLDAHVVESTGVGIDVPAGMVLEPAAGLARGVARGTPLGRLVGDPAVLRTLSADGGSTVATSRLAAIQERRAKVSAPVTGGFRATPTPRITRQGLDLIADLNPLQALRYRGMAFTGAATVETVLGQQEVPCVTTWIVTGKAKGGRVHCRLADSVETTAGIPGVLTLTGPKLTSVVAVPLRYVGLDSSGKNYVARVVSDSGTTERPVVVGVTDGVRRVVLSGIHAGDELEVATPR
jgi:hypothetical protein